MKKYRVAHITGGDIALRALLMNQMRSQQAAGYDVVGVSGAGEHVAAIVAGGVRHIAVPLTRRFSVKEDLKALIALVRLFRRERFDIVHTHTPKGGLIGQWAALLARVPIRIHTIHGLYFPGHMKPKHRWIFVLLERITMWPSHLNLSQSPEDMPVAVEDRICDPAKLRYLGNGIDLTAFDPARFPESRRQQVRQSLGLSPKHVVIGMVARFVAEKGYRELLRAAQVIKAEVPNVRFLFIGSVQPEKNDALSPDDVTRMGLDDVVKFLGHREDVNDLYAAMDIATLPSYREGFPRVSMEAAAMGIPSVVTNIRGCRQTVVDGVSGYLVPVRDADALATALLDLVRDKAKRERFGQAARAQALAEFDERVIFNRVLQGYADMIVARGGTPPAK